MFLLLLPLLISTISTILLRLPNPIPPLFVFSHDLPDPRDLSLSLSLSLFFGPNLPDPRGPYCFFIGAFLFAPADLHFKFMFVVVVVVVAAVCLCVAWGLGGLVCVDVVVVAATAAMTTCSI